MSCMCGDTACPSCGPAQGHNPAAEQVAEWLMVTLMQDERLRLLEPAETAYMLTEFFGAFAEIAEAMETVAARHFRFERMRRDAARRATEGRS